MRVLGPLSRAVVTAAVVLALPACSVAPTEVTAEPSTSVASPTPPATLDPTCHVPSEALTTRIAAAVGNLRRDQVTKAFTVEAPSSDTGRWLIVAGESIGVYDDGRLGDDASPFLALVSADDQPEDATVITLDGLRTPDWTNVDWGPELRKQGEVAVDNANDCLDQATP
jgi:hypothetical protein